MRRALVVALSLVAMMATTAAASAAELKVGVIDVEYVIQKSKAGQGAKATLKKLFDKKQKELDAKQKDLLEVKKQLENPSDLMTDKKKKELLTGYQQGLLELQNSFLENQQELQKKEAELMKPILQKLEKVLTAMAEKEDYDLIMNRSQNGVLFTKPAHDMTEAVLAELDKK